MDNNKDKLSKKAIIKFCRELKCCDSCCLRFAAVRHPNAFEDSSIYIKKLEETTDNQTNIEPPLKKQKLDEVCVSCLGILQRSSWPQYCDVVKKALERKCYDCESFGFALSAPLACSFRDKIVTLKLQKAFPEYDSNNLTPLKEAGKWSLGVSVAEHINKTLESGSTAALLLTLQMQYENETTELETLKQISPATFNERSRNRKRFTAEFSRCSVESALNGLNVNALQSLDDFLNNRSRAECSDVQCSRMPIYLGGRYIKLSRQLPQTPWLVNGKRMMDTSIQEIIFGPIIKAYGLTPEEGESTLKFMSAGREDVDVRCLGDGRPFAIEISNAARSLTETELKEICKEISLSGSVIVNILMHVTREDLTELKKGEETKCKTYEAICIKLTHSKYDDVEPSAPITVTDLDILNINSFRNTPVTDEAPILLSQRTPIRVVHRRPLLVRPRRIYHVDAGKIEGYPQLFKVRLLAEAGCYIKEWCCGELGRTRPGLGAALAARVDVVALDVAAVHLHWPSGVISPPNGPVSPPNGVVDK